MLGAFFTELYPTLRTPHPVNVIGAVLNHIVLSLTTIGLLVGWREEAEHELRRQAETDGLTGLLNRRTWRACASAAIEAARRHGESLAVLMLDIDHFKRINDPWGHEVGDRAFRAVARVLRECDGPSDLLCRYGGEEFCLLLPGVDEDSARHVDERLRAAVQKHAAAGAHVDLSFSSGLALLGDGDRDIESLLRRADFALYRAKAGGRDRLISGEGQKAPQSRAAPRPGRSSAEATIGGPTAASVEKSPAVEGMTAASFQRVDLPVMSRTCADRVE